MLKLLLPHVNINSKDPATALSLLQQVVALSKVKALRRFFEILGERIRELDPNLIDDSSEHPIIMAQGSTKDFGFCAVKILLDHNDVYKDKIKPSQVITRNGKRSALCVALKNQNIKLVKLLLQHNTEAPTVSETSFSLFDNS